MKTQVFNHKTINRKWYLVDASDMVLGRMASEVAKLLIGKGKPAYSPNQDHGDHIVIINSDKVVLTGKKESMKSYFRHSTYAGGEKFRSFREQMEKDSTRVIRSAVHGMMPKTHLGKSMETKLHVYPSDEHPHSAQKPEQITFN
ncbi:MAG: 50S ribosomal protein L13 [Fibrobacterota bacterium]